jgi:glycosyltransferase involved in cell wall biosynthesis
VKVVVVSPAVPHPFGETAARGLYVLVTGLLARGIGVSCLVVTEEDAARVREARERLAASPGAEHLELVVFAPTVRPVALRKLRSLRRPFSETLHADGLAAALERQAAAGWDVLHLDQLWSGWVGLERRRVLLNVYQLEVIDWEARRGLRLAERKALLQMRRATRRIVRGSRHIRVASRRLLERARAINPTAEYSCVPFALDVSLYPLQPLVREPVVGLLGSMHWLPSRSAAERLITRIWPRVKRQLPRARLLVGGWNARRYLDRYASPDIRLVENLAHPSEFFSQVAVLAYAPVRGSGVKVKVLEAMAYGVPVVTTREGIEGLDCEDGVHCWVREDDEALAERIVETLGDETRRARMREAGRALVEARHSSRPVLEQMLGVYDRVRRE